MNYKSMNNMEKFTTKNMC